MELYLADEEITTEVLAAAIRRVTLSSEMTPVLAGTALKNKGVQQMLDAVIDYLPAPTDVAAIIGNEPRTEKRSDS